MQWNLIENREILTTVPFNVEELHLKNKNRPGPQHPFHRLTTRDWVNVLPVTAQGQAVLIEQSRAGTLCNVIEVPGGEIDKSEKDPTMAALRELEEETGYSSQRILPLAAINPNPALFNNRVHMFLALDAKPAAVRKHFQDENEDIQVRLVPLADLDGMIRHGTIDSCLSCLTILLAKRYIDC